MKNKKKRVLVACEYSARVRDAFRAQGHDAWSCDILPTEGDPRFHFQSSVETVFRSIRSDWDLLIGHPPCTYLANSGARHLYNGDGSRNEERWENLREGARFFRYLWTLPFPQICLENPVMLGHAKRLIGATQSQTIQPWQFGHGETKRTCLWLKGLPLLQPTDIVEGREQKVHLMSPGPDRWKNRSRTFQGIADAMANQWGGT